MKKSIYLSIFYVFIMTEVSALAYTDQELRQLIQDTITLRHPTDNASWWRGLGSNAPSVMMSMYQESSNTYHRIRLIEALGWFNDESSVSFLKNVADTENNRVVKNTAIRAVSRSQGLKEKDFLSKYLEHSDPIVRAETAKSITLIQSKKSDEMVGQFLSKEKTPWVISRVKVHQKRLATHQSIVHKKSSQNF